VTLGRVSPQRQALLPGGLTSLPGGLTSKSLSENQPAGAMPALLSWFSDRLERSHPQALPDIFKIVTRAAIWMEGALKGQHRNQISADTQDAGQGVSVANFLFPRFWIVHTAQ